MNLTRFCQIGYIITSAILAWMLTHLFRWGITEKAPLMCIVATVGFVYLATDTFLEVVRIAREERQNK